MIVLYVFVSVDAENNTFSPGLKDELIKFIKIDASNPNFVLLFIMGKIVVPIIFSLLSLLFIRKRMYGVLLGITVVDLILEFSLRIPALTIIVLILLFTNSSRSYLKTKGD